MYIYIDINQSVWWNVMSGFWMLVRCFVYPSSPKIMVQWNMPFFCKGNGLCGWTHSGVSPKWMVYNGKTLLKWVIWGYHHFRKPLFYGPVRISNRNVSAGLERCRKAIMEGELRIGLEAPEDDHRGSQLGWYHPSCLWKTFSFQKNANKKRLEKKQHTNQNTLEEWKLMDDRLVVWEMEANNGDGGELFRSYVKNRKWFGSTPRFLRCPWFPKHMLLKI